MTILVRYINPITQNICNDITTIDISINKIVNDFAKTVFLRVAKKVNALKKKINKVEKWINRVRADRMMLLSHNDNYKEQIGHLVLRGDKNEVSEKKVRKIMDRINYNETSLTQLENTNLGAFDKFDTNFGRLNIISELRVFIPLLTKYF